MQYRPRRLRGLAEKNTQQSKHPSTQGLLAIHSALDACINIDWADSRQHE